MLSKMVVGMKMEVYGFKARVHKDGKWLVGEIPELHIHDQARTLRDLENELKDAVDTVVEFAFSGKQKKIVAKSPLLRSLLVNA
jgi:predicted RNase H-like HicB family nuclease